jgi:hypothetical protein
LRKVADFAHALNFSVIWLTISGQDFGKGGLASTISANQANFVSFGNSEINFRHKHARTDANLQVGDGNHEMLQKLVEPIG